MCVCGGLVSLLTPSRWCGPGQDVSLGGPVGDEFSDGGFVYGLSGPGVYADVDGAVLLPPGGVYVSA